MSNLKVAGPGKKILWGICGIGMGHTYRQLPLLLHFAAYCRIVILAYGESFKFYEKHFSGHERVTVLPVVVPYLVGSRTGLDFEATATALANQGLDFSVNWRSLARVQEILGKPDLVISDYEPVSAQYAYSQGAPLVTIDQQSKYLCGDFPEELGGQGYLDECQRLRLFFPRAAARLAVSFFRVPPCPQRQGQEEVTLFAPVINQAVRSLHRRKAADSKLSIVVYISSQKDFVQPLGDLLAQFGQLPDIEFALFLPAGLMAGPELEAGKPANVLLYKHGSAEFHKHLERADGLVSTAGHTLLAEAMYLGIPTYAVPLPVYEQVMNAHVIDRSGFGVSRQTVVVDELQSFIARLPEFARAIAADTDVLMRGSAEADLISLLHERFLA